MITTSPVPESEAQPQSLPRILGLFDATMIVVGSIIGSGIFLKVGNVDQALQSFGFLPIIGVWLFVGVVTLCGSLTMGELGTMFPRAGGPYLYLREAYGQLPAFLWGWTEFWVVRCGSVGALASATVIYFNKLVPLSMLGQALLAIGIVVGLSAVNWYSTRWGATVQNVATVAKLTFLGGLIVLPFLLGKIQPSYLEPLWYPSDTSLPRALGIAMVAVLWPYDGWINLGPVAEEIRNPRFNLPRAMALGMTTVILAYVGANLAYHLTLPMHQLAETETAAADVFGVLFGPVGSTVAAIGVMCSTFGATNSNMITGPRIYFAVARDGLIPNWVQRIHPAHHTPSNAILLQAIWTTLLIAVFYGVFTSPRDAFDGLTNSVVCAGMIFYSLTVGAVYVLRFTQPDLPRPYRTWGYPITPALLIVAYAFTFVGQLIETWQETAFVLGLIAAGTVYYFWAAARAKARTV